MNEPNKRKDPKVYRQRLDVSRKWREDYSKVWKKMVELYKGKQHDNDHNDVATINVAKSTIDIIFASTTIRAPKINVFSQHPEHEPMATSVEAVVNYWWKRYGVHDEFRAAFKDALVVGHGWLKTTYRFEEVEEERDPAEIDEMIAMQIAEADMAAVEMPELAAELPTDDQIVELVMDAAKATPNYVVTEDHPEVVRIDPLDMFVDPEATSLRDATWLAQRIVRPLEDVKKDKRYRQSVRKNLQSSAVTRHGMDEDDRGRRKTKNDEVKRVVLYEFYDLVEHTFCVFAEGGDEYLLEPTEIPFAFGHPFVMLRDYDVPGEFYPIGEIEPIANLQEELNETRSQLLNHRKKYARKHLVRRSALTPDAMTALRSTQDGALVFVDDPSVPFSEIITPIPQTSLQGELYNMTAVVHEDIERVSGVNEYMRGASPQIRRTATEAAILQDAAAARAADKLEIVENAAAHIGMRMVQLAQEFLTTEQAARIVSPQGNVEWVMFDREAIQGQFDFETEAGSTMPRSDAMARQDAINLLQMMGPFIGQIVDGTELVKMVLRKFGEKEPEKFLIQQQPMMPEMAGPAVTPMAPPSPMGMPGGPMGPVGPEESISGIAGAPQAMNMQGAFDGQFGDALSPEMLAQLAQQMGLTL